MDECRTLMPPQIREPQETNHELKRAHPDVVGYRDQLRATVHRNRERHLWACSAQLAATSSGEISDMHR